MKFIKYIKDKLLSICIYMVSLLLISCLLYCIGVDNVVICLILVILVISYLTIIFIEFYNKKKFYDYLILNTKNIDKKYFVLETLNKPNSYEESIIYETLYDINKSMIDNVNNYKNSLISYKEFLEIWIHEVKIPISSMLLLYHNHEDKYDKKISNIINMLDNDIDRILYYVRSEDVEKDFLINEVKLKDIIHNVILKNKDDLLLNKIDCKVNIDNSIIYTDKKWIEFIINQIINNSIKYKKEKDSIIKISSYVKDNKVYLEIYDNGIGIRKNDINRVFDKSFTGLNGRGKVKSTGMGLYIVNNLCKKLGHNVYIESAVNKYTKVSIVFGRNDLYKF